jgi:hypothetical protein
MVTWYDHPRRQSSFSSQPLNFLIERQRGFVGNAIELFDAIRQKFDSTGVFGEIGHGDRLMYPPPQAADLLVYEATRKLIEDEHNSTVAIRRPFEILSRKDNIMLLELRSDMLQQYVDFLREDEDLRKKT